MMPQATKHEAATVTIPSERAILITRTFDAPRALVFETWTKPEHVARWWDPGRVPLAVCEIDLRPGGAFRFVHGGTSTMKHEFAGIYREVDPPSRLVFQTKMPSGVESTGTVVFSAHGDTTTITLTIECASRADRDAMLAMRVDAGTMRTLDNLALYVGAIRKES